MSKESLRIIFVGLFILMVPITSFAQTEGVSIEKDVFLNTPILVPEDLPESIIFNLYDNEDALISIGSQTFSRGQYSVDFQFRKSDGVSGGDVARVKAAFTEKLNLTDAQGESIKPKELWVSLTVGDEEVGSRTKVSDETMVQLLLNSEASIATYLTLVYEGDDNPIATIYKDLPMSTVTGGGSYSSLKDYFTVVAGTGEAAINADTRADYWLAGTGGIYYNGNVGVNNTAPNRDISVKYYSAWGGLENLPTISVANTNTTPGEHSFASFEFSGANGGVVGEFFADGGGYFLGGPQSVVFRSSTYDHMLFGTNKVNRMIISKDGDVGIGTTSPGWNFHVKKSFGGHIACFQNTMNSTDADVLRLQIDLVNTTDPGSGNNFITFAHGNTAIGNIDGNAHGDVRYNTSGADFAEWLPKLRREEVIEPGDIVGVVGGKISKQTENAEYVQAISTAPGWVGNCPSEEEKGFYEQVAFMGQVPVRVRGSVKVGDYIVSSGLDDGTGVAISPDQLRAEHHGKIIGRAWEASTTEGEKMINTAVSHNSLPHELYREKDEQIEKLASEVESLKRAQQDRVENLERALGEVETLKRALDGLMKKVESLSKS
jgi:hypothetical protein